VRGGGRSGQSRCCVADRASLGHRDRTEAKNTADEIAAAFARKEAPETLKREPGEL
jgi:hypothetical protein